MRFVYVDEAGTAANEPVTVVVGIIAHADEQVMFAEAAVIEVLGAVPAKFKDGFVFHAKKIWGAEKYRDGWGMADRLALLRSMMSLPRRLKMPLALGLVRRDWDIQNLPKQLTLAQFHHVLAFQACIARADKFIRDHAGPKEIGSVVAEDVPEMRKFLRIVPKVLREQPFTTPPDGIQPTAEERKLGYIKQESDMRVTRIRRSIHFVEKEDDPLLLLSDACAFGIRRYFAGQKFGDEFAAAIYGKDHLPIKSDYGPLNSCLFFP